MSGRPRLAGRRTNATYLRDNERGRDEPHLLGSGLKEGGDHTDRDILTYTETCRVGRVVVKEHIQQVDRGPHGLSIYDLR
jgi:hypothetical protein